MGIHLVSYANAQTSIKLHIVSSPRAFKTLDMQSTLEIQFPPQFQRVNLISLNIVGSHMNK